MARLVAAFRRDAVADDIREELESHLRARIDEYTHAGLSPDEARRRAHRRFGNVEAHVHHGYAVKGSGVMETIWQDVKYAVRSLRRQPGFAVVAIATLALGIGASTAIFSVIDAAILRPLPYPEPELLVEPSIAWTTPAGRPASRDASVADMRAWAGVSDVVASAAAVQWSSFGVIADGPQPERLSSRRITEGYLDVYGAAPVLGRAFTLDDMRVGDPAVVMLGHGFWQRRFGGDPGVVGQPLRGVQGSPTIVGVLPSRFFATVEVWQPMQIDARWAAFRGTGASTVVRLRPGVTIEAAVERLSAVTAPQVERAGTMITSVHLDRMLDLAVTRSRTTVGVMAGAVALVLLLACVNVGGLMLARGAARQSEMAVRASLGAGRGRLVRQLLTEGLVLAAVGGGVGVLLALAATDVLVASMPLSMPANAEVTVNVRVLLGAGVLTIATGLLCALAASLKWTRTSTIATSGPGRTRDVSVLPRRSGQVLIATEVALALILAAGAGLMVRSLAKMMAVDLGFDPDPIYTMHTLPLDDRPEVHADYYPRLIEAIRTIPGVTAAGAVDFFPLDGSSMFTSAYVDGAGSGIGLRRVQPGYFETLGLRAVQGRLPQAADERAGVSAALVNESAARALFPDGSPIGRTFAVGSRTAPVSQVLGVVPDVRPGGPTEPAAPEVYLPFRFDAEDTAFRNHAKTVVVRLSARVPDLAGRLRDAAASIGPRVLVEDVRPAGDALGELIITPRRRTILLSLLGALGLLLALVGIFGVTAYTVARRTREIGVRMAFGARPGQVVGAMLRDAVWPVAIGLAAGIAGATFATKAIATFLFETTPTDVPTFAAVAITLALAATIAAWIPARRAASVDPMSALRAE